MERIHVDIVGPLPLSDRKNEWILVCVDQFTKWMECYALPHTKAELLATALVDEFISRLGAPRYIHTDQGKNVDSNISRAVCDLLGVAKTRTTPYHPSGNGQVERYNKTLLQMVRCYLAPKVAPTAKPEVRARWDVNLHLLSGALRAVPNRITGYSPNMMMLGREVALPQDIVFDLPLPEGRKEPPEYVRDLRERLAEVHRYAWENLKQNQAIQKQYYDRKNHQIVYDTGDLVYKRNRTSKKGQTPKLQPVWTGPYIVEKSRPPGVVHIKGFRKREVVHHDQLTPCHDRHVGSAC